jgi:energy-coupling factor transport system permease protein
MLKDITLGQFFPGNSLLHKADPRMKIILTVIYIVFVFLADTSAAYLSAIVFTVFLIAISRIKLRVIIKGMKPLLFIMLFTAFFNIFWTKGETAPLFEYGYITVYKEGLWFAAVMILRVACILAGSSLILTYTTSPIALTDGLERLLSPLKKIKLPVHEFSMMMTIALRFIPTLIEETDKIMNAQKARGADFNSGGLIKRAKALLPVLIPLFASSFRRAGELATAMECRCYRGDNGRTRMNKLRFGITDLILLIIFALFATGVILCNIYLGDFLSFGIA